MDTNKFFDCLRDMNVEYDLQNGTRSFRFYPPGGPDCGMNFVLPHSVNNNMFMSCHDNLLFTADELLDMAVGKPAPQRRVTTEWLVADLILDPKQADEVVNKIAEFSRLRVKVDPTYASAKNNTSSSRGIFGHIDGPWVLLTQRWPFGELQNTIVFDGLFDLLDHYGNIDRVTDRPCYAQPLTPNTK